MKNKYMEKYKDVIYGITHVERRDGSGNPFYMEDYECEALNKLNEMFPNIYISAEDLIALSDFETKKHKNDLIIEDLRDNAYGYSFYDRHGHSITEDEREKRSMAEKHKPELDNNYNKAVSTFLEVCETLNDLDKTQDEDFDIEDVFDKMYEYKLKTSSKDKIIKNYYKRYKAFREKEEENGKLKEQNTNMQEDNTKLKEENVDLKNKNNKLIKQNSKLTQLLSKTLTFCENVKNSKFGKFLFKKQIKALPEPDEDIEK